MEQLAVLLAVNGLVRKEKLKAPYDFKKARLVKSDSKDGWYILYYVWDVQKNGLVRKRNFIPSNYKTDASKTSYAKDFIRKVNALLKEGFHVDRTKARQKKMEVPEGAELTIEEAKEKYEHVCSKLLGNCDREVAQKRTLLTRFFKDMDANYGKVYYLSELNSKMCQKYIDELIESGKSAKTVNNSIGRLKHFYNIAKKRSWYKGDNPFDPIEKLRTTYGEKNIPFLDEQLKDLKEEILNSHPYLWNFIGFIYYAFMRPAEIRKLKVKNIDFQNQQIRIESWQSKVRQFDILPIAPPLMELIESMNIKKSNPNHYLFTNDLKPGTEQMTRNWSTGRFKTIKKRLDLEDNYTLYGFKHTAICRWYDQEKDILRIQKMCRHTTIEMTACYLKSLGLMTDIYKVDSLPTI